MAPAMEAKKATFAAGCFWSAELAFQRVPGVISTMVGYTQGHTVNPIYEQICSGTTGHVLSVLVKYNPIEVTYEKLLEEFWRILPDPTQVSGQAADIGSQYRSGIYFHTPEQQRIALASIKDMEAKLGKTVATELLAAKTFYPAEDFHQQYLERGRSGKKQSARKACNDPIRCYG